MGNPLLEGLLYLAHFAVIAIYHLTKPIFSWLYDSYGQERLPPMKNSILEKSATQIAKMIRERKVWAVLKLTFYQLRTFDYGEGGLQNGKIAGPKHFASPLHDRVKLFVPPPPLKMGGNLLRLPLQCG